MNIETLLDNLADAIASNATLSAYATTTYGRTHKVFVNADQRNPPASSDAPVIVIYRVRKTEGQAVDVREHVFTVRCAVYDTSVATPTYSNQTVYNGGAHLETIRRYARDAIKGASMGSCYLAMIDTQYGPIEEFPWFRCDMTVTISETALVGVDPFE